jgi:hypothetical protein
MGQVRGFVGREGSFGADAEAHGRLFAEPLGEGPASPDPRPRRSELSVRDRPVGSVHRLSHGPGEATDPLRGNAVALLIEQPDRLVERRQRLVLPVEES